MTLTNRCSRNLALVTESDIESQTGSQTAAFVLPIPATLANDKPSRLKHERVEPDAAL